MWIWILYHFQNHQIFTNENNNNNNNKKFERIITAAAIACLKLSDWDAG